jgi:hypothetical protein
MCSFRTGIILRQLSLLLPLHFYYWFFQLLPDGRFECACFCQWNSKHAAWAWLAIRPFLIERALHWYSKISEHHGFDHGSHVVTCQVAKLIDKSGHRRRHVTWGRIIWIEKSVEAPTFGRVRSAYCDWIF